VARASLAIPVDCYRDTAEELLRYGRVVSRPRRAWLGVFATPLDDGVVIAGVVPGGPGEKGGLREGDMVVSLNAQGVSTRRELYSNLWRHEPGERLTIEVMRDNALRRLEITGGDRADFFKPV
jgi:S1-C subfamily serine protease